MTWMMLVGGLLVERSDGGEVEKVRNQKVGAKIKR
jgi:hypothetical protein